MAKKRKTRLQKVRSTSRRSEKLSKKSVSKITDIPKDEVKPTVVQVPKVNANSADLARSLKIVGLLILSQFLIWGILHMTHIDTKLYEVITI